MKFFNYVPAAISIFLAIFTPDMYRIQLYLTILRFYISW